MRKEIVKWGDSAVIRFSPKELEIYGLKVGDVIDLSDMVKVKGKKG
jgi:antitoxin component of MazEF toxin-antitoxin module